MFKKTALFLKDDFPKGGGGRGSGITNLYVKFWWLLFLALKTRLFWPKVTFGFLNVPRGGGSTGLGNFPKFYQFF